MKIMIVVATAALLALAACGEVDNGGPDNATANQANAATTATATPEANAAGGKDPATGNAAGDAAESGADGPRATAASPSSEIRALLVGRWTDNGDCAAATDFRADGTFTSPVGAGRWTLESEYLTLSIAGAPDGEVAVQEIDRRGMETVSPSGRIGRWTRC